MRIIKSHERDKTVFRIEITDREQNSPTYADFELSLIEKWRNSRFNSDKCKMLELMARKIEEFEAQELARVGHPSNRRGGQVVEQVRAGHSRVTSEWYAAPNREISANFPSNIAAANELGINDFDDAISVLRDNGSRINIPTMPRVRVTPQPTDPEEATTCVCGLVHGASSHPLDE